MAGTSSEAKFCTKTKSKSSPRETPTINNYSTKTKSKFSIRSYLVANLKAKFCVSKPKPDDNSHHNAAGSSVTSAKRNDHHREDLPPPSEMISNDLLRVDSALKDYTDHMNIQINLAREKFKELQNSGSSERVDFEELRKAIAKLKWQIFNHHGEDLLPPSESEMIYIDLLRVDSALKDYTDHMNIQINSPLKDYTDQMNIQINLAREKFKELQNSGSSERVDFEELRKAIAKLKWQIFDHHGEDLLRHSEMISNDLLRVDSALKDYTDHMNIQINLAREKFKELQNSGSSERVDFEELRKAIAKLKWQIFDHQGEDLPPPSEMISNDLLRVDSALKDYTDHMNIQINLAREKFKELQNSGSSERVDFEELRKAIAKLKWQIFDHQGEDLPPPSEMISNDLLSVDLVLKDYTDHMNIQINLAREKFKEVQNSGGSERVGFEELRKAIAMLKWQIPARVNKHDHLSVFAHSDSSKMIHDDLLLVDSTFDEVKKYMDCMSEKINQAHGEFKKLQILRSSPERKRDVDELKKAIKKLKVQIPSHVKIRSADSNRHPYQWPHINNTDDRMSLFFYEEEPQVASTSDSDFLLKAFRNLPWRLRYCLLCFFKFPPEATIKRTVMIYLWIGQRYTPFLHVWDSNEDRGNEIFDELVKRGFIQPIYQSCSLVPDSCRMSLSVRSALLEEAKCRGFTSHHNLDLDRGPQLGHSCMINVGEAILKLEPEIFGKVDYTRSLYLGRWQCSTTHHIELADWQRSTTHHIELADAKILHGLLQNMKSLKFLSLRGISMITELPISISDLKVLEILDLRACHNLETIPDNIGSLKSLTHLDMSECYFLEHMPKSLAQLSSLEVLKGFFIGDFNNIQSCTLYDLSRLPRLRKLNIYVSVKDFHRLWDFNGLQNFKGLQKLTISWGGCSLQGKSHRQSQEEERLKPLKQGSLPPNLQKLDLQCFPTQRLTDWLRPAEAKWLKKLYLRGGQLCNLGRSQEGRWNVEILRLKHLEELEIDWSELSTLYPKLIYLQQVDCPKLRNFPPCDKSGVWKDENSMYIQKQLQKYSRTCGINSSSMVDSGPTLDRDDSNICPVYD